MSSKADLRATRPATLGHRVRDRHVPGWKLAARIGSIRCGYKASWLKSVKFTDLSQLALYPQRMLPILAANFHPGTCLSRTRCPSVAGRVALKSAFDDINVACHPTSTPL